MVLLSTIHPTVPRSTIASEKMATPPTSTALESPPQRQRILHAAMALFMERGYAATSTLAIASAAKVSKRDLYAAFSGKQAILAACVRQRAGDMQAPLLMERPTGRDELTAVLVRYGVGLRTGVTDPQVIAAYRLAIQEVPHNPEVAQALHEEGRMAAFRAVVELLRTAQANGVIRPGPAEPMAALFLALLIGDLVLEHLLGFTQPDAGTDTQTCAERAAAALLGLYGA